MAGRQLQLNVIQNIKGGMPELPVTNYVHRFPLTIYATRDKLYNT